MIKIGYYSEPVADYHKELDACGSLSDLRVFTEKWRRIADDAFRTAKAMSEEDWPVFRKGLKSERRGRYAGDTWSKKYADILMPSLMFHVSITANHFMCPWGTAYCRHRSIGDIEEREDGISIWKKRS